MCPGLTSSPRPFSESADLAASVSIFFAAFSSRFITSPHACQRYSRIDSDSSAFLLPQPEQTFELAYQRSILTSSAP